MSGAGRKRPAPGFALLRVGEQLVGAVLRRSKGGVDGLVAAHPGADFFAFDVLHAELALDARRKRRAVLESGAKTLRKGNARKSALVMTFWLVGKCPVRAHWKSLSHRNLRNS